MKHELGIPGECVKWGKQVLDCRRTGLALHPLRVPHPGVRGRRRAGVEGRVQRFHLQHAAAGLRAGLLRPLLPYLSSALMGHSAHHGVHSLTPRGSARGLQGAQREQAQEEAVPGQRQHRRRAALHLHHEPGPQNNL